MCQGKARILFKFEKADCKIKCFYFKKKHVTCLKVGRVLFSGFKFLIFSTYICQVHVSGSRTRVINSHSACKSVEIELGVI